jgi:hypothetical protein
MMRTGWLALVLAFGLAACRGGPATPVTALPPPVQGTASPAPITAEAATQAPAVVAPTAVATPVPSPTSLAEGLAAGARPPGASANCPGDSAWFFDNRADECADTLLNTWAVWQPFERGLMLWFQEGGRTYVLRDDGSLFKPFAQVRDLQGLPMPEADPELAPPPGLYQPVHGFALFWRGLVPGHEWVRQELGWATAEETGYSAFWQCNTGEGNLARCYFNGPRDEVISLTMGSGQYWNYWQTAVRQGAQ